MGRTQVLCGLNNQITEEKKRSGQTGEFGGKLGNYQLLKESDPRR
jgi:hypothetical protein